MEDVLNDLYFNQKTGFIGLNELIRRTRDDNIPIDFIKKWYKQQAVNQIIIPRRNKIYYHKTIGDGHGYQADIIFFPNPRLNDGYVGLLTFINTSTRRAYVAMIKNRSTDEIIDKISVWIDHVEKSFGKITSIATDNELYNNKSIYRLFQENDIEQFVEDSGEHSKLGIINRFHRTLRELLNRIMTHNNSKRWIDFIGDAIYNYNHRIHRTLGKAPIDMTISDVVGLNKKLHKNNRESINRLNMIKIGDKVRYLLKKSIFGKGGKRFSDSVWIVKGIDGFNIEIERGSNTQFKKYWELNKVT